jgi:hypothetical protein
MNSPSALKSKSYSNPEATLTSPSVAWIAVRQGKHSDTEMVATVMDIADMAIIPLAKCSRSFVQTVARKLKFLLSLAKVDQCTAEIATTK